MMPGSIYQFVKKNLISHGVDRSPVGRMTLEDKSGDHPPALSFMT
jgi:hypothetical protein